MLIHIDTDDFNIFDLVGTEVVAHISPASITGKQKIGEGERIYTFAMVTSIQCRAIWRRLFRHSAWRDSYYSGDEDIQKHT